MRAINIKKNNMNNSIPATIASTAAVDLTDRQPCWYANLEDGSDRLKAKWVVGVKKAGQDPEEHSFKASKAGDVTDDEFWAYITSPDFAIELIELFKRDGKKAVTNWVKNGCA